MKVVNLLSIVGLAWGLSVTWGAAACAQTAGAGKAALPVDPPFSQGQVAQEATPAPGGEGEDFNYRISGQITSARRSELSFRVTGYVKAITKKAGARVKTGEILAELDDADYQLALKLAESKKHQAAIEARAAKNEYERELQLKKENASTGTMFDKIQAAFEASRLGVAMADLNLQQARRNLAFTKLLAPYDGVVAEQEKDEGEYVSQGTKVFTVYEVDHPEVDLNVPERLVGKLNVGNELTISVPSVQYKGRAKVIRWVPVVSDRTRTFRVTAQLLGDSKRVVPGLFAEALLN